MEKAQQLQYWKALSALLDLHMHKRVCTGPKAKVQASIGNNLKINNAARTAPDMARLVMFRAYI
jgi:hypothetical protein